MDSRPRVRDHRVVSGRLRQKPTWIAWGLAVAAATCYPPTLYLGLMAPANVPPVLRLGWWGAIGSLVGLAYCVVGALIIRRHHRHVVGWLAGLGGFATSLSIFAGAYAAFAAGGHPLPGAAWMLWLRQWLWDPGFEMLFILIPAVFPDGRLLSRRWGPLVWLAAASALAQVTADSLDPTFVPAVGFSAGSPPSIPAVLIAVSAATTLAALFAAVASVVVRFQRSRGVARQQMKWFVAAVVLQGILWAGSLIPALTYHVAPYQAPYFDVAIPFALLALPLAIGIGILRHRLYDIDLVISRGVAYAALAAFITAAYLVVVVGAGLLIGTGGRPNLPLSIVATALVAVLFQPMRARIDRLANRLVYGAPANPYEALARLSQSTATGTTDDVLRQIAHAIASGAGAERARVRLLLAGGRSQSAASPTDASGRFGPAMAVHHRGELVGEIEIAGGGEARLTEPLVAQVGLVLHNLRLSAELADRLVQIEAQAGELTASRMRLVKAQEVERRRLERDLHDGVQQELVALIAKVRLARNQLARDPELAEGTLAELQAGIQRALNDLREVAHGVHPAVLGSRGLVEAVEAIAGRMPLGVLVKADSGVRSARYAPEIEGAAYYVVAEGLANVLKHAGAGQATVSISAENSHLTVEVSDDGHGFAVGITLESGLRGLRDRVEALGGRLGVESRTDGTRLEAWLPARDRLHA
jgi:signal transduction histidine kinase